MTRKNQIIIPILAFLGVILAANFASAQIDFGLGMVNNGLGGSLAATDPRVMAGRVIQIALGFLGVIAVVLIMTAGFLWATSAGDEEKITRAKAMLRNAVIGLIIILSAWGIATFVITRLIDATGGTAGPNSFNGGSGGFSSPGVGAIGACTMESTYPANSQSDVPRNTAVMATFKETVNPENLCHNSVGEACTCDNATCRQINPTAIRVYKTDLGDACAGASCPSPNGNVTEINLTLANEGKTIILTPANFLGSSDGNTQYSVKLSNQVKKLDGTSMFKGCGADFAEWSFTVSSNLDLTPPLVALGGIFPLPDNEADLFQVTTPAKAASGVINVAACPKIYAPAEVKAIKPIGASPANAQVALDYHGPLSVFKIAVPAGGPNKAQLFDGNGNLLGVADFNDSGQAVFKNFLTFTSSAHLEGNAWEIDISPEQAADTLTINDQVYTFAAVSANNQIKVPAVCDKNAQALNIQAKLSGDANINVDRTANIVSLTAKVAGQSGNNIAVLTSAPAALAITPLTGGADKQELTQAKDKKDRPMNSAIQINFNKAVNPLTVSGSASEVDKYIRVVNANASSSPAGTVCHSNADCRSYKCENSACVGNYLGGKFLVSNGYRTVEFLSDRECGLNGCGEKIYCLPANSHLAVELMAADLKTCASDIDCAAFTPFTTCAVTPLGYKTCQDAASHNYPTADVGNLNGIIDAAANSLDGNRSAFSDGPLSFYNDNYSASSPANVGQQDKYKWSFYINDQIMINPPQITAVKPIQGTGSISLTDPVEIDFNTLMLNSTLRTGSVPIKVGTSTAEHKLINLRSTAAAPLGYWILSDNIDMPPLNGEPDLTIAKIWHSPFAQSVTFRAQVGSGVKDIYQNCFKPSSGPGCLATPDQPSCCLGAATAVLSADGNCQ
ncbi:MAG: Ig-like domain-containing protein [Patescibacteria group bacterium]